MVTLTFSLQSLGSQLLGQLHELTVCFADLLVICIQIFSLLGALLRLLRDDTQSEQSVTPENFMTGSSGESRTQTAYLFSEPLLPLQPLLPPLDL